VNVVLSPPIVQVSILVVDDQPKNIIALEAALANVDCRVVRARSGREALKWVLAQDFAAILLDIRMPDLDGFDTAGLIRMRDRSRATPIIFLSAYHHTAAEIQKAYRFGGIEYLSRPLDPTILRVKVSFFVELFRKSLRLEQQAAELSALAVEVEHTKEHFRALIEDAADLTLIVNASGVIRYASPSVEPMLGYSADLIAGHAVSALLHPDDVLVWQTELALLAKAGAARPATACRWRHAEGTYRSLESTATNFLKTPSVGGIVVHARDITERRLAEEQLRVLEAELDRTRAEAELRHQSLHDGLTELPNRVLLSERLEQALEYTGRDDAACALLVLDVDRFNDVNDALGRHVGDSFLRQIGERIVSAVLPTELVARLGGDEFAVLLPEADTARAAQSARDLVGAFETPFMHENQPIHIRVSIGVAVSPQHGRDAETLLRRADMAMYQAKRSELGVAVYNRTDDRPRPHRLALLGEFRQAIERDELVLHYQPKVDLQSGALAGVEALVRWQHPQRGLLPPSEFIPQAEQSGLIHSLGLWVLETALQQQQAWRAFGIEIPVAINVSRQMLYELGLPEMISHRLMLFGAAPTDLILEITESGLMADPVHAHENLSQLRALGVRISIDDFGTGYSSLASLKNLPVDELKIDQSFVQGMPTDGGARAIVRAVIDLADALNVQVVAEGVEDRATCDVLAGLGCDVAQGYFLCPPLVAAELVTWVAQHRAAWVAIAEAPHVVDPLRERIRGRGARLTAEEEFIARKQAEAALRASEERNRLGLQAAHMGTFDRDPLHDDLLTWSPEMEALHGVAPGTFEGTLAALQARVHPDDWPGFELEIKTSEAEHRETSATYRAVWPDGSEHWLEVKGRGQYTADGTLMRVSGTSMDITERKAAEEALRAREALRASEERFRTQHQGGPLPA
jgi:diguanylate cyclase (GGDEF)-like protein/PAS domain S-box-containing protein